VKTKEKEKILQYLQEVTTQTNIKQLLKDLNINNSSFYQCKYSLEKMQEVQKEMKKRLKQLSK